MPAVRQIEIDCRLVRDTEKAILIETGRGTQVWVPKSQITDECEVQGKLESVFIPEWLAVEKGLV